MTRRQVAAGLMRGMTPVEFARRAPGALTRRMWWTARASLLGRVVRTSLAVVPRQRLPFAWRELTGSGKTRTWLLKDARRPVTVRSGSRDRDILREIFVDQAYAPPPEVAEILRSRKQARIVDLGANIGLFGVWVLSQWPEARVHGFEPDPANLAILDQNIAEARVSSSWSVTRACATAVDGHVRFLAGRQADSRIVYDADPTPDVTELPAVNVFPHLKDADLLKIDIEGGEWALLTDGRFGELTVPAIVIEYHAYNCPEPADSAQTARRLLERCGYTVLETYHHPSGVGRIWAWRSPLSS